VTREDVIRELAISMLDQWEPPGTVPRGLHRTWKHTCGVCVPELDESRLHHADYFAERGMPW